YGETAVQFYRDRKDLSNLARALQALANTCRLAEDEPTAKRITRSAWHILNEKYSRTDDSKMLLLLHQSTFWDLRLFGAEAEERSAKRKREQLVDLANR